MNKFIESIQSRLPAWAGNWLDVMVVATQLGLIFFAAWLLMRLVRRLITRLAALYALPPTVAVLSRRVVGLLVYGGATLWSLERMGVSGSVLWTAFTGFAAVGAVAFFAAWSVLSNLFCALLIFTTRAFRPGDLVELLEAGDKPGLKGRVVDINLVYTTLAEPVPAPGEGGLAATSPAGGSTTLQVPNALFFQRALRRWPGGGGVMG